jgi:hypothetical protein
MRLYAVTAQRPRHTRRTPIGDPSVTEPTEESPSASLRPKAPETLAHVMPLHASPFPALPELLAEQKYHRSFCSTGDTEILSKTLRAEPTEV